MKKEIARIKIELINYVLDVEHQNSRKIIDAIVADDYENEAFKEFYEEEKIAAADINDTEIVDMIQQLVSSK